MNQSVLVALAAAAALTGVASAHAQGQAQTQAQQPTSFVSDQQDWRGDRGGWDRDARITFYEYPNFQGRSFTLTRTDDNFVPDNFNDRAQSARVEGGDWRLCEHVNFGGRCVQIREDVRDLNRIGLNQQVSSAMLIRGDDGRPPWGDDRGGYGGQRYEGAATVFFPQPRFRGRDIQGNRYNAENFCRQMNLGQVAYWDGSERGRTMQPNGRETFGPVLRDVLCRRR